MKINPEAIKEMKTQIKLQINEILFKKGLITEEMYKKAKNIFLTT